MKNTSTRTIRTNTGKLVECIEMQSGGNKYGTQLNSTENKTIIHTWHAQMSHERDIHTNDHQERNKDARKTNNWIHVQRLYTVGWYEGGGVADPGNYHKITKRGTLWAINLIKEKIRGKLKGIMCAYSRPQRLYISKEDAS